MTTPPPKEKNDRKKLEAAKAIDRPNTIWISLRKPPDVSPNASERPVTMMMMTAMILATGPSTDCRIWLSGCSQGMLEPAAKAGLTAKQMVTNRLVETTRRSKNEMALMTVPYCCEAVVTGRPEVCDTGKLGQAALGAATRKDDDDVDRLRDEGARDRDNGFL